MNNKAYPDFLHNIAQEFANLTVKPGDLQAILLQGSVAKGIADVYSDIELTFLWRAETTAESRAALFSNISKESLFPEELEDGEWCSVFIYKDIKIDVYHLEMPLLQKTIDDVMAARTTSISSQTLLASIQDSEALYGQEALDTINARIVEYPAGLSTPCIKVNASFTEWTLRNALLDRQDMLALHHLIDLTLMQMLRLLYALNKTYLRSYNFKWLRYHLARLSVKPDRLENRLESIIAGGATQQAINELNNLLHEVFNLIAAQRPDIDMSKELAKLNYTRQKVSTAE